MYLKAKQRFSFFVTGTSRDSTSHRLLDVLSRGQLTYPLACHLTPVVGDQEEEGEKTSKSTSPIAKLTDPIGEQPAVFRGSCTTLESMIMQ